MTTSETSTHTDTVTTAAAAQAVPQTTPAPRSYPSLIGGRDVAGQSWVYSLGIGAWLADAAGALKLKHQLDTDGSEPLSTHPDVLGRCALATTDDLDAALQAAADAAPRWAAVDLHHRMRLLARFDEVLRDRDRSEEFIQLLVEEGHPAQLARWELEGLRQHCSPLNRKAMADRMETEHVHDGQRAISRQYPDGVVALVPPANAPAALAGISAVIAAAGNTVVVRAPRTCPLSTMWLLRELLAPLAAELGAPPGTINVLCADPEQSLDHIVQSPDVRTVVYFGATARGLAVQSACAKQLKRPVLELAGNDGMLIWRDADLDAAAESACQAFLASGQICMVPNYLIVHPDIAEDLLAKITERIRDQVHPGHPADKNTVLAPVRQAAAFFRTLEQALNIGAELVCGGHKMHVDGTRSESGLFLEPTVLRVRVSQLDEARAVDACVHETFFPLLPVIVPDTGDLDAACAFMNSNAYGLRNSLWASAQDVINTWVSQMSNGGLLQVNRSHLAHPPGLPTNGGTGRSGGAWGEAAFFDVATTHEQGVCIATPPARNGQATLP